MTYDLTVMARARRLRALAVLNQPRRARPVRRRLFSGQMARLPLAA